MKLGKMILGGATLVLAAVSAFAFRTTAKSGHRYFGTNKNVVPAISCTASTCFQPTGTGLNPVCHSLAGGKALVTIYTQAGNCQTTAASWTVSSL